MADEETKTDDGSQVDNNTTAETNSAEVDGNTQDDKTKTVPEPSDAEKKLTEQMGELQGKFDSLSQGAAKNEQLLKEITPFVNWDGMKAQQPGGETDVINEEEDQTFLTQKEAKALEQRIDTKIRTSEFQRDFRENYPDLGDKGPKEEMVRYFFENKTLQSDSFEKRLESAAKSTRAFIKSEQDKGAAETKADKEKATQEEKTKAEAAAKASGLSSAGITSPQVTETKDADTNKTYISERKAAQKTRTTL